VNSYTPENQPKNGNALKIWNALTNADLKPAELHYNPNCWGRGSQNGYGTWACTIRRFEAPYEFFCGVVAGNVYIGSMVAPYNKIAITEAQQ
jgi:hypothetical protein